MELPFDEKEIIKDPEAMLKLIQKLMLRVQSLERQLNSSSHFSQRSFSTEPKKEKESANWNIKTPDIIIHYFVRKCKNSYISYFGLFLQDICIYFNKV